MEHESNQSIVPEYSAEYNGEDKRPILAWCSRETMTSMIYLRVNCGFRCVVSLFSISFSLAS